MILDYFSIKLFSEIKRSYTLIIGTKTLQMKSDTGSVSGPDLGF